MVKKYKEVRDIFAKKVQFDIKPSRRKLEKHIDSIVIRRAKNLNPTLDRVNWHDDKKEVDLHTTCGSSHKQCVTVCCGKIIRSTCSCPSFRFGSTMCKHCVSIILCIAEDDRGYVDDED